MMKKSKLRVQVILLMAHCLLFSSTVFPEPTIIKNTRISGGMVSEGNSWSNYDLKENQGQTDSFYLSKIWLNFETELTRDPDSGLNIRLASYGPNSGTVGQEGSNGRYALSGSDYYTWGSESNFNTEPRPSARQTGLDSQEGVLLRVDQAYLYFNVYDTDIKVGKQNLALGHGIAYALDHQDGVQFRREFEVWDLDFGFRKIWEVHGLGKYSPTVGNVGGSSVTAVDREDELDDGNGSTGNVGGSSSMDRDDYYLMGSLSPYEGLDINMYGVLETMINKRKYYLGASVAGLLGAYSYDLEMAYMGGKVSKGFNDFLGNKVANDVKYSAYALLLGVSYDFGRFSVGWNGFYGTGDNPDTDKNEDFGGDADWGEDDKWDSGRRIAYDLFVDEKYPFSYDVTNKISNTLYADIGFSNNKWKVITRIINLRMEEKKQSITNSADIGTEFNMEVTYRINQFFIYSFLYGIFSPGDAWGENLSSASRLSNQISANF